MLLLMLLLDIDNVSISLLCQSVELERLAVYLDSDISPWHLDMLWEKLLPSEWVQVCC